MSCSLPEQGEDLPEETGVARSWKGDKERAPSGLFLGMYRTSLKADCAIKAA